MFFRALLHPGALRPWAFLGIAALLLLSSPCSGQSSPAQADFATARAQVDPAARVLALRRFLDTHARSPYGQLAAQALLQTLLDNFPEQPLPIHNAAAALLALAQPGLERWSEESRLANELADAGSHGANLDDANVWATGAVRSLTEPAYRQQIQHMRLQYHLPAMAAQQLHAAFERDRAAALVALANVRLQQSQPATAEPLIAEALRLTPHSSEALRLRAQLALTRGQTAAALTDLIQADALSPLPPAWHAREAALFHSATGGDTQALEDRVDAAYQAVMPPLYRLPPRTLSAGGHPVLLQLFTGSDCLPCAGPDLAVDSLLSTYSRTDLIALELDLHIPLPDPLTTPATIEQAALYRVERTPSAFLDGQALDIPGSTRDDVENIVIAFADQIEAEAEAPSPITLILSSRWSGPDTLEALPSITQAPSVRKDAPTAAGSTDQVLQRAILHVALVQDQLRYPGKNGVRFHRMVVRALLQAPARSLGIAPSSGAPFRFDLGAIQARQSAYLAEFETQNDHFGALVFRQKGFPLPPDHLALVAWLQDPLSRRVLQSTYLPLPPRSPPR